MRRSRRNASRQAVPTAEASATQARSKKPSSPFEIATRVVLAVLTVFVLFFFVQAVRDISIERRAYEESTRFNEELRARVDEESARYYGELISDDEP